MPDKSHRLCPVRWNPKNSGGCPDRMGNDHMCGKDMPCDGNHECSCGAKRTIYG